MKPAEAELKAAVAQAYTTARQNLETGRLPTYIPELARADPSKLAVVVRTLDGGTFGEGDLEHPFTFQSISKVFTLAYAFQSCGLSVIDRMSAEPSGDAFHSIVKLEEEHGRPRNPYINAGAIMVSEQLPGRTPEEKIDGFIGFLSGLAGGEPFRIDPDVYRSESATGNRNRALAHFMKHHGLIEDPAVAVDTYFRQCSIAVTTAGLARIGAFLANRGVDPVSGGRVVDESVNRTIVALMTTCGLYDEVGSFAIRVGLPAKSGVSGAIFAVVPDRMTIAAYSPRLGPKGNSVAGMAALEKLSGSLGLSIFG